ncbi:MULTISPECIES: hypothetical protein [unclassified Microbacterium]|uniref:hypothetical protein n=1 Tax=unclassified Microbacterium TaxID=2609290 RepID=UPI00115FC4A7|nr:MULTISPECIES: hypothetical protein [unclassified Microbacterium]
MTDDAAAEEPLGDADDADREEGNADRDEDDEEDGGVELTPEQAESLRRTFAIIRQGLTFDPPAVKIPEAFLTGLVDVARIVETQQKMLATSIEPIIIAHANIREQMAKAISSDAVRSIVLARAEIGRTVEQLTRNIDFAGIAAKVSQSFAEEQLALLQNLGPALEAMRASFYPPNLREISKLKIEAVNQVVMAEGIALYGLPRSSTAEALVQAKNARARREILGRRWKMISADCRAAVLSCTSAAVAPYVPFAVAALDALDSGHSAGAQALTGSLIDAVVTGYFGRDRYKYTPNKKTPTNDAYNEFTIREFIAFAPMWQAYQQFYVSNGDKVPSTFSRNATAHTVSPRQFSRRNAVQGLMLACSLLYRLDEEASYV